MQAGAGPRRRGISRAPALMRHQPGSRCRRTAAQLPAWWALTGAEGKSDNCLLPQESSQDQAPRSARRYFNSNNAP